MDNFNLYMERIVVGSDGTESREGVVKNLRTDFPGLEYDKMVAMNTYGTPAVYIETMIEKSKSLIYVDPSGSRESTDVTLTLYFFDSAGSPDDATAYTNAQKAYNDFLDYLNGHKVVYWDTYRNRKLLLCLNSSTEPKTDRLYGIPYLEAEFKFKNEYGKSFALTDTTF